MLRLASSVANVGRTGLACTYRVQIRRFGAKYPAAHVKFGDKQKKLPVILLRKCELGRKGDQVMVSPGYMRNHLYERRMAVYSTPSNIQKYFVPRSRRDQEAYLLPARMASAISSKQLVVYRHAPPGAVKPLRTVNAEHLAEKVQKQMNISLKPSQIELEAPLSDFGETVVPVRLDRGHRATLLVSLEPR